MPRSLFPPCRDRLPLPAAPSKLYLCSDTRTKTPIEKRRRNCLCFVDTPDCPRCTEHVSARVRAPFWFAIWDRWRRPSSNSCSMKAGGRPNPRRQIQACFMLGFTSRKHSMHSTQHRPRFARQNYVSFSITCQSIKSPKALGFVCLSFGKSGDLRSFN